MDDDEEEDLDQSESNDEVGVVKRPVDTTTEKD